MVLVEGEAAGGVTVDQDAFHVTGDAGAAAAADSRAERRASPAAVAAAALRCRRSRRSGLASPARDPGPISA